MVVGQDGGEILVQELACNSLGILSCRELRNRKHRSELPLHLVMKPLYRRWGTHLPRKETLILEDRGPKGSE